MLHKSVNALFVSDGGNQMSNYEPDCKQSTDTENLVSFKKGLRKMTRQSFSQNAGTIRVHALDMKQCVYLCVETTTT